MLRSHNVVCTGSTGVSLTVTHGLGVVPDRWFHASRNLRCRGTYYLAAAVLTNVLTVVNSLESTVSLDVFCWVYQGRLY